MSELLIELDDLVERLPFTLSEDEVREARGAIADLSDDARFHGGREWDDLSAPQSVKNLVAKAAARHMKNYEGFTVSRAGDETVQWSDDDPEMGTAHFTGPEIDRLKALGGVMRPSVLSVPIFSHESGRRPRRRGPVGLVPDGNGGFVNYFADPVEPW